MHIRNNIISACFFLLILSLISCKEKKPEFAHTNALIKETSPYLLQHAHNPVDWIAWSDDAFAKAKKEDKLVIISIGYSSCHWCHVMEHETFEDTTVARLMNQNFIPIKVDREERPDVDHVYMTAAQLMTGQGGWPLNIIALPNGKPIYAGTYHTKADWKKVLNRMIDIYKNDPKGAARFADQVATGVQQTNLVANPHAETDFTDVNIAAAVKKDAQHWDGEWGGYTGTQKFPLPGNLDFLMDYALLHKDTLTKSFIKNTLDHIVQGGIYDHLGGGFFRYSTDARWQMPHFEKMLYDNAQLISTFSKAYQVFKEPAYKNVVYESIAFLGREMKNPEGGYYSAIDADSEGKEGKYYTWKKEELKELLGRNFELFARFYDLESAPALEENSYVLRKTQSDSAFAKANKIGLTQLQEQKDDWQQKLLSARQKRVSPQIDDKIIISWNALLINGFIDAYEAFGEKDFLKFAVDDYDFLQAHAVKGTQLNHSYKKGGKVIPGFLDDHAFMIAAALKLYGASTEQAYLDFAKRDTREVLTQFSDSVSALLRYGKNDQLISKIVKTDDGVIPSGNAVMAQNLFKLWHILGDDALLARSRKMLAAVDPSLRESTSAYSAWGDLYLNYAFNFYEVAIVGQNAKPLLADLQGQKYQPNVLFMASTEESGLPLFEGRFMPGETLIYVCENRVCKIPIKTVEEAMRQLTDFKYF